MSIKESFFLDRDKAVLVVIDVQEKLCVAMDEVVLKSRVKNIGILLDSATELNIPVILTEQYTKGLGATLPELKEKAALAGISTEQIVQTLRMLDVQYQADEHPLELKEETPCIHFLIS